MLVAELIEALQAMPADAVVELLPKGDQDEWDVEDSPPENIDVVLSSEGEVYLIGSGW